MFRKHQTYSALLLVSPRRFGACLIGDLGFGTSPIPAFGNIIMASTRGKWGKFERLFAFNVDENVKIVAMLGRTTRCRYTSGLSWDYAKMPIFITRKRMQVCPT
jgi:hypothetical protein